MDPVYKDASGQYRWRLRNRNGEIVDASTEGFVERRDAVENMRLAKDALGDALQAIDDIEPEEDE